MKAKIGHIGINLSNAESSFTFWRELFDYLGFSIITDDGDHFDAYDGRSYLCICTTRDPHRFEGFHRRRTGLSHVAFTVPTREDVDRFTSEFLAPRGIQPLYGGAKPYPDYTPEYYAVFFEDPDRIKIEITFDPPDFYAPPTE